MVLNTNFSSISAILWCEHILYLRHLEDPKKKSYLSIKQSGYFMFQNLELIYTVLYNQNPLMDLGRNQICVI
jgi:hypothetical protein